MSIEQNLAAIWRRRAGLSIAVVWSAFWIWFGLACGLEEGWRGALIHVAPLLSFALLTVIAWRLPRGGPWALIVAGLAIAIAYPLTFGRQFPFSTTVFMWLTMAWPPILAGLLMLTGRD